MTLPHFHDVRATMFGSLFKECCVPEREPEVEEFVIDMSTGADRLNKVLSESRSGAPAGGERSGDD